MPSQQGFSFGSTHNQWPGEAQPVTSQQGFSFGSTHNGTTTGWHPSTKRTPMSHEKTVPKSRLLHSPGWDGCVEARLLRKTDAWNNAPGISQSRSHIEEAI